MNACNRVGVFINLLITIVIAPSLNFGYFPKKIVINFHQNIHI